MRFFALILAFILVSANAAEGRRTAFVGGLVVGAVAGAILESSCVRGESQPVVRQEVVYVEREPQVVYVERPVQVVYVERPAPQVVYVERQRPTVSASLSIEVGSRRRNGCGWVPPVAHPFPQGR
jgi:hypothetical protein